MPKSLAWALQEIEKRPDDASMIWAEWRRDQPDGGDRIDKAIEGIKKRYERVRAGERFEDVFVEDPNWSKKRK